MPVECRGDIVAGEFRALSLGAACIHRARARGKREELSLRCEPLEIGHKEERGAEKEDRSAILYRLLEGRVGEVPLRLSAANDPRFARGQLLHDPVDHEPKRRSRRLGARRPEDDRGESRAIQEHVRREAAEERSLVLRR